MNRPNPDDMKAMGVMEYVEQLEKKYKELKEELKFYYKAAKQFRKDKDMLMKENEELKKEIAEYDDLTEELDYRKREAKRLGWNSKDAKKNFNK